MSSQKFNRSDNSYVITKSNDVFEVQFDPSVHSEVSTVICTVIADLKDRDPLTLEPLHQTVDPDALNSLFRFEDDRSGKVTFEYDHFIVTVLSDGTIRFLPIG